jgi:alkylation response protein AidB-like acyl-CoA dehydrogenase
MSAAIVFSEEQELVASSARDVLRERVSFDDVRAWMQSESGYDDALYREVAQLGWIGMASPERLGGAGLGATELVSVVESMGRHAFASPFLASVLASDLLLQAGSEAQQEGLLPRIAAGEMIATAALGEANGSWDPADIEAQAIREGDGYRLQGEKAFVLDAQNASLLLVACRAGEGALIVALPTADLPAGTIRPEKLIDGSRRSARVRLDGVKVPANAVLTGGDAGAAGALLVAAEMSGAAEGAFALTLDYLKSRVQFGRKIGAYQALKHPMVWLRVGIEQSRSLLYHAATLWDTGQDASEVEVAVRSAKFHCGDTCTETVDRAIQFHGAYGFTWECHAQLFFRRAQWAEYSFGDSGHHRRHLANLLLCK